MKLLKLMFSLLLTFNFALAHEGHNKTPGALSAPHGGLIKGTDSFYLEVVTSQNEVKVFPLGHDMKPVSVASLKLDGKMTIPRKNKSEAVKFSPKADYFSASIDAKGAHRYDLELSISKNGKVEKQIFTIEPQ